MSKRPPFFNKTGWDTLDAFRVQNRQLPKIANAIDEVALTLLRYEPLPRDAEERAFFELVNHQIGPRLNSLRIRLLYDHWLRLADGGVPASEDLDPAEIASLLPNIMIVTLSRDPFRVFYELVGSEVARFTGLEFTGHYMDELRMDGFNLEALAAAYISVRDSGRCGVGMELLSLNGEVKLKTEYLICPFGNDAEVDQCVVVEDYFLNANADLADLPMAQWVAIDALKTVG